MHPCAMLIIVNNIPGTMLQPRDSSEDMAYKIAAFMHNEGLGIMFLSFAPIKPKAGLAHEWI